MQTGPVSSLSLLHYTTHYYAIRTFMVDRLAGQNTAASMVVEGARSLGRVRLHGGMTSYLGCAWWVLELHGCYCMGACIMLGL